MMDVLVNNRKYQFNDLRELVGYLMELPLAHAKYGSLDSFKDNVKTASHLVTELCDILHEDVAKLPPPQDTDTKKKRALQKMTYTRLKTKINTLTSYCVKAKTKESVYQQVYDFLLSLEGKALLAGFKLGHKIHKDVPRGNAERISMLRPQ